MAPFEYMAFVGWAFSCWAPGAPAQKADLYSNLAGNAFSAFALAPLMSATIAVFGWAHRNA